MSLNQTPAGDRIHIGFFGKRNAGKSSVMNAVTGQNLAIVSDVKGTTTDPVYKAMELLPLGPVMLIDTPGLDDEGELGLLRVRKARQALNKTDFAVLVADGTQELGPEDEGLIRLLEEKKIGYVIAYNKVDLMRELPADDEFACTQKSPDAGAVRKSSGRPSLWVSAKTGEGIRELKERIAAEAGRGRGPERPIVRDLLAPGETAVLVTPIDEAAPKGRLILPQQQTIRDILEADAVAVVTKVETLTETLSQLVRKPRLVITDSQAFAEVAGIVPEDVALTSFSILFARHKGDLEITVSGAAALENLKDGDRVLLSEGCTHHRQCGDIGTVKLPEWIRSYTGKTLQFEFTSGTEFPEELASYRLIVHCGGCMLNPREMQYRLACAADQGVPITNYGMLIAYMNGILERSMAPLKKLPIKKDGITKQILVK